MHCTHCAENLTAFLDGELSRADAEQIKAHLGSCASCAEELRSLREAGAFVVAHSREPEPHPGSWNLIRARIRETATPAPARLWQFSRWRAAVTTAAIIAACALGYLQHQQVQKKNLDQYIMQYVQQRNAQISLQAENNPFMESRGTLDVNPFRSEDR